MKSGAFGVIPGQRSEDLVVRAHGEETLVLDRRTGTVHCLPAEVTRVWDACTGRTTLAEIASAAEVDEHTAAAAVAQLMLLDLLENRIGFDRRMFLRRSALVGAGVATVPVIESCIASPAWAQGTFPDLGTVEFTPTCVSNGRQAQFTLSFSHGTRNLPLTITATSIHPGGGPDIAASSTGFSLDGNGNAVSPSINMPPSTYATATFNVYGIATPITIVIRNSATGQVLAEFEEQIGPCFNPSIGTVAVTPSCSANGQAQWSAGLSNFDGLSILTVTATAQGPNGPVSDSVIVTTNNGGFATITARDFGNPGDFPVGTGLTITVSEGGTTVATYPNYVIGPCGSPAAAGSSPKIRSGSSSPKPTPTRTAPSTAPATSSSTAPAPPGTPPASPSPASPPTSGKS